MFHLREPSSNLFVSLKPNKLFICNSIAYGTKSQIQEVLVTFVLSKFSFSFKTFAAVSSSVGIVELSIYKLNRNWKVSTRELLVPVY